jgi:hypothetical protein
MKLRNITHWRTITLVSLLASALAVPGSTAAVPTEATDLDATPPRRIDTPTTPSLWDQQASPAPVNAGVTPTKPAEPMRAKSANPLWAIPLATLTTTRDRPIFSPSRRPPPPAVVPAPVAAAPPPRPKQAKVERPQLTLVGTIGGPDEQSFGIFVDQTTKAALRLKIGEEYQGWRLRNVAPREVTLEHDEQTTVLSLPAPDANAAQQMTMQAQNNDATTEPRRPRSVRH